MKKDFYKRIEHDLYNYNMYKIAIENLKRDIEYLKTSNEVRSIDGISYEEPRVSETYDINKIVEDAALSIHESIEYKEMTIKRLENKLESIDNAMKGLTDSEFSILKKRYIEGKLWHVVAYEVNYNERWCKELRRRAVNKLIIGIYGEGAL